MSETLLLSQELIRCPSVTPNDAGCQAILTERLTKLGFVCEQIDREDVQNLWAIHGNTGPLLVFAGHTDVVPAGAMDQWRHEPFSAEVIDGMLYGRGAADMKGSIAAFTVACEQFLKTHSNYIGRIGFLITSDEEGPAKHGTKAVIKELSKRQQYIDMCIVGEPSSSHKVGDVIKVGRRGSLHGVLTLHGKQGHIAYPHLAENPIHKIGDVINILTRYQFDYGNENFDPTSLQISNIHAGNGTTNIIPAEVQITFNFRYSPESTQHSLKQQVESLLAPLDMDYHIDWELSGEPFETKQGDFINCVLQAMQNTLGYTPTLSTSGGTSDGRFIAPTGTQLIELGPINATIHQVNEHVSVNDLDLLADCYYAILKRIFIK